MEIRHSCRLKVIRLLGFDRIDGRKQGNFGVKRTICFDLHPSQEEISLTETVESRAQLTIISGTANNSTA